jgi:hypothetical protein
MKPFITRHRVAIYFALTVAISWGGVLLVIGGSRGMSGAAPTSDPPRRKAAHHCRAPSPCATVPDP